jgi:hypothetical protein
MLVAEIGLQPVNEAKRYSAASQNLSGCPEGIESMMFLTSSSNNDIVLCGFTRLLAFFGTHAADCCLVLRPFFSFIQKLAMFNVLILSLVPQTLPL